MSKIEAPKRIRAEDYSADDRNLVTALGNSINDFFENVYQTLSGNIDFDNLAQSIVEVEIKRDSAVLPASSLKSMPQVKTGLNRKIRGIQCIAAFRTDSSGSPESQPFITFTINSTNIITIQKVTGLQDNSTYTLRLLLIT